MQHGGLLVGVLGCFLVPACVRHPMWVVGVGACLWVGHKRLYEQTHCRVHVQHRVSVRHVLWWLPTQPASLLLVWVCVVGCL